MPTAVEDLLTADVVQLEFHNAQLLDENRILRLMLSELLDIAHQAIASYYRDRLARS